MALVSDLYKIRKIFVLGGELFRGDHQAEESMLNRVEGSGVGPMLT